MDRKDFIYETGIVLDRCTEITRMMVDCVKCGLGGELKESGVIEWNRGIDGVLDALSYVLKSYQDDAQGLARRYMKEPVTND